MTIKHQFLKTLETNCVSIKTQSTAGTMTYCCGFHSEEFTHSLYQLLQHSYPPLKNNGYNKNNWGVGIFSEKT